MVTTIEGSTVCMYNSTYIRMCVHVVWNTRQVWTTPSHSPGCSLPVHWSVRRTSYNCLGRCHCINLVHATQSSDIWKGCLYVGPAYSVALCGQPFCLARCNMWWADSPSDEMPPRTPLEALRLSTCRLVQTVVWRRDTSEISQSDRSNSDVCS